MARTTGSNKFTAQVDEMIITSEKRMIALIRESLQRTIDDAQTPVKKGGRMRIDTGFLRASGQPSLTGLPTGPMRGDKTQPNSYDYDAQSVVLILGQLTIGAVFYFGWTAAYAKYREAYDGFLSVAVQKWPETVAKVTEEIRNRIK